MPRREVHDEILALFFLAHDATVSKEVGAKRDEVSPRQRRFR
jgi:hypothetical protein